MNLKLTALIITTDAGAGPRYFTMLRRLFPDHAITWTPADGDDAPDILARSEAFDLVIIDLDTYEIGMKIMRLSRAKNRRTQNIICVDAKTPGPMRGRIGDAGADGLLIRPVTDEDFNDTVSRALGLG